MKRPVVLALLIVIAPLLILAPLAGGAPAAQASPARAPTPVRCYLPLVLRPPSIDLSIDGLEITQGVQDGQNRVPLVAGRSTVVRVYARASGGTSPANVTVTLRGTRGGTPLPGSPLTLGPLAVSSAPSRGALGSSVNFALPAGWLGAGTVTLVATVDAHGAVAEPNEANNTATATVALSSVPPLRIMIVPVNYTHSPTGRFYPAPSQDTISNWIGRAFPLHQVSVTLRTPPFYFTGDLKGSTKSWDDLLLQVVGTKTGDGAPSSQVYYGFVSTSDGGSDWLGTGGVVGYGRIGSREAVGLDLPAYLWGADMAGQVAAHEIGHNLGRDHAPCGNPDYPDPNYPYPSGYIGQYGLDIGTGTLWAPTAARDLMSYCQPQWLSDYTYRGLYDAQRAQGAMVMAARGDGLLVRAALGEDGATLLPVYALPQARLEPTEGEYRVELLDGGGAVVASHPVRAYEAEVPHPVGADEDGGPDWPPAPERMIHVVLPRPAGAVTAVRLVHGGRVLAERPLAPGRAVAEARLVTAGRERPALQWDDGATPALVRYTVDDGATWVTLAVDALGGELAVDLASLPEGPGRFQAILGDRAASESGSAGVPPAS